MKAVTIQIFFVFLIYLKTGNSDRLLAIQRFGAGYPSFHSIRMANDGEFLDLWH